LSEVRENTNPRSVAAIALIDACSRVPADPTATEGAATVTDAGLTAVTDAVAWMALAPFASALTVRV
jgi:hypothetical protein